MAQKSKTTSALPPAKTVRSAANEQYIRVRVKALELPPVKDGLVVGRSAPIGAKAMLHTLKLMSTEKFIHLTMRQDEVVADVIVREAVVRKMTEPRLREFVLKRVKPLMTENELLLLDMEIEVVIEHST